MIDYDLSLDSVNTTYKTDVTVSFEEITFRLLNVIAQGIRADEVKALLKQFVFYLLVQKFNVKLY